jgi:MoaE-MoaD fusion protein
MIHLQHNPICVADVEQHVISEECGATLVFVGRTRNSFNGKSVIKLFYEAYEQMALKEMTKIKYDIEKKWPKTRIAMVHRLGEVGLGEASIVIAISTPHRDNCYKASRYAIDTLKKNVPIWKKEIYEEGSQWKANQLK